MEREVGYAIGWLFVVSGLLAVLVVSCFPRYGYRTTTAGLLLGFVGLLIAGHAWAAVLVFTLTLAGTGTISICVTRSDWCVRGAEPIDIAAVRCRG
jgi:hypothetical protein